MGEKRTARKRITEIHVNVDLIGFEKDEKRPLIKAYLFSSSGELLDSKPLDETGKAILASDYGFQDTCRFRVAVGPETDDVYKLQDYRARIQIVHAEIGSKVNVPFEVQRPDWICWWPKFYFIVGDVKKKISVDSDTTIYAPICNATVEIYEVDYLKFIVTLPDNVIESIRKKLIKEWRPRVFPPPPPPPPVEVMPELMVRSAGVEASPAETPIAETSNQAVSADLASNISLAEIELSPTAKFRQLLIDKAVTFKHILCPWFSHLKFVTLSSLGTVTTDATGHFQKLKVFFCPTEEPDLYFVVRQVIGGNLKDIYAPRPIPCYTYWNYKSGTNVHIIVTDPSAIACFDQPPPAIPGLYVMPLGIGNDGWYDVDQAHIKPLQIIKNSRGLYLGTDPYGINLDIQMQFHDGLRGNGVMYYRWSYRRENTTEWTHINRSITHRYLTVIAGKPVIDSEGLGPKSKGLNNENLFLVPDPAKDWVVISREDRAFAIWDTSGLPNGKYQLLLEMFDINGNKITNPATKGFKYFLPTAQVTSGVWPVDDALHIEPDGGIILNLHIDNSDTVADIMSIALGGIPAGECQFLKYQNKTENVGITYVAYHPNGFLDHYDLTVRRGISGTKVASISPIAPASVATTQSFMVQALLGDDYDQCSFGVWLHTWPRTRDGYTRIRAYEADDSSAFALVK
jgi:hypothetical protein